MTPRELARLQRGRTAGYTLAEVVVAVLILTTIGVAYYSGLSNGFSLVQSNRDNLRATQILMQKLEGLRLCTWSELTNCSFVEVYDPLGATNGSGGTIYRGTITTNSASVIPNASSYKANMRQVTVSVYWTNYNGRIPNVHNRQMQTQVARYGIQNYIWGQLR